MAAPTMAIPPLPPPQHEVSTLEKHHRVIVQCIPLEVPGAEHLRTHDMLPVENSRNRYEPQVPIQDDTVERVTGWLDMDEVQFQSFYPTENEFRYADRKAQATEYQRFAHDMEWAVKYIGHTKVSFCTVRSPGYVAFVAPEALQLLIHRSTLCLQSYEGQRPGTDEEEGWAPERTADNADQDGDAEMTDGYIEQEEQPDSEPEDSKDQWPPGSIYHEDTGAYDFPLKDFLAAPHPAPCWWWQFQDLIMRRSDRAVRQIALLKTRTDITMEHNQTVWKAARQPDYQSILLPRLSEVKDLWINDGEICAMCKAPWEESEGGVVRLPCNHAFCKDCILSWVNLKRPDDMTCPTCRAKLLPNKRENDRITFGLDANYVFWNDPRFNPFENWERSCADLDVEIGKPSMPSIPLNVDRVVEAWDLVLAGARLEGTSSAAKMHLPVYAPEMRDPVVMQCWRIALSEWAGVDMPVVSLEDLFATAAGEIINYWQYRSLGMQSHVSFRELKDQLEWPVRYFLRLGLEKWCDRMVLRTLMMMKLRLCENPACQPRGYWHKHGDRDYYVNTPKSSSSSWRRNSLQTRSRVGRSLPLAMNRNWGQSIV